MARLASEGTTASQPSHNRTRSNPFKALIGATRAEPSQMQPRSPTKPLSKRTLTRSHTDNESSKAPTDHGNLPLGEIHNGQQRSHALQDTSTSGIPLHQRTKSAISLKSFVGNSKPKLETAAVGSTPKTLHQAKKSKSSTSLASLFSRPKSRGRKDDYDFNIQDKENTQPLHTPAEPDWTPIWAQFTSARLGEDTGTTGVPLCESTPQPQHADVHWEHANTSKQYYEKSNGPKSRSRLTDGLAAEDTANNRRGSRVQAAVAALNGKAAVSNSFQAPKLPPKATTVDKRAIDIEFEALLESRNIPPDVREKMRTLSPVLKVDFIQKNQRIVSPTLEDEQRSGNVQNTSKSFLAKEDVSTSPDKGTVENDESPKKSRPRSFTLGLSKNDSSPTKKQKHSRSSSRTRPKSIDLPRSWSSTSLASLASNSSQGHHRTQKHTSPEEFISYFRTVKRPQDVEVGKIQKLRQLLRNETVTWVETFISSGGMEEVVSLLYRIIEVEWREDHEDALMHHTLSCLKALATTSSGLEHLAIIQARLFPALLQMLFSSGEEKKGPSEFTTRGLIIALLFAFLQSSPDTTPAQRADILLGYLRDQERAEMERPPAFMLTMHRPRPYRTWMGEISGVTKEVFWIFLHHVNIIPYPAIAETDEDDDPAAAFLAAHFPAPRPPVPAAPYVGGVEWDATNYLTAHLDLMNGLIASLPTATARNDLREALRSSGAEKIMGVSLRTCKEKFYGAVHAGLGTWVGAAHADGWSERLVRQGPTEEERRRGSPSKARPAKPKKDVHNKEAEHDGPPRLQEIQVGGGGQLNLRLQVTNTDVDIGDWL